MKSVSDLHTKFTTKSKELMYKFEDIVLNYDEDGKKKMAEQIAAKQVCPQSYIS